MKSGAATKLGNTRRQGQQAKKSKGQHEKASDNCKAGAVSPTDPCIISQGRIRKEKRSGDSDPSQGCLDKKQLYPTIDRSRVS